MHLTSGAGHASGYIMPPSGEVGEHETPMFDLCCIFDLCFVCSWADGQGGQTDRQQSTNVCVFLVLPGPQPSKTAQPHGSVPSRLLLEHSNPSRHVAADPSLKPWPHQVPSAIASVELGTESEPGSIRGWSAPRGWTNEVGSTVHWNVHRDLLWDLLPQHRLHVLQQQQHTQQQQ